MRLSRLRTFSLYLVTSILLLACSTTPTGRKQLLIIPESQAISMSKQAYVDTISGVKAEGKLIAESPQIERIRRITDRLVVEAKKMRPETRDWNWEVNLIDESQVNAWCMAGGKMAVYTGLLNEIQPTDDELAQVMGHEISHALANHTAERMSVAMATQLGIVAISMVSEKPEKYAMAGALAAKLAIELPNSRTGESEADRIGIELAAKAGYDPRAAVTLWQKMGRLGGAKPPEFLSTHPSPENRQKTLQKLAQKMMPYYQAANAAK